MIVYTQFRVFRCSFFYLSCSFFQGVNHSSAPNQARKRLAFTSDKISSEVTPEVKETNRVRRQSMLRQSITSTDPSLLVQEIRKLEMLQRQLGEEANRALDVLQKEVACNRLGTRDAAENVAKLLSEIKNMQVVSSIHEDIVIRDKADLKEEIIRLDSQGSAIESLEKKLENVQNSLDRLVGAFAKSEDVSESKMPSKKKKGIPFSLTNSPNFIRAPCSPLSSSSRKVMDEIGNKMVDNQSSMQHGDSLANSLKSTPLRSDRGSSSLSSRENTPAGQKSNSINVKKMQRMFSNAFEGTVHDIKAYVTELKERVAKLQYQKQLLVCQVRMLINLFICLAFILIAPFIFVR